MFGEFLQLWNRALPACALKALSPGPDQAGSFCYDVVDFAYTIDGAVLGPKALYISTHVAALRDLAALTRMSMVADQYDEAGVRRLRDFDMGGRSDELWIVNEARLVRHHPDSASNVYVDAFFSDVLLGVEVLAQQAATLGFLGGWLRRSRSEYLSRLLSDGDRGALETLREILVGMAGASELFGDPIVLGESSGHSFFRNLMTRMSTKMAIAARRTDVRESFDLLLQLSQAIAARDAASAGYELQALSVEIAKGSQRLTRNTYIVAIVAIVFTLVQVWIAVGDETSGAPTPTVTQPRPTVTQPGPTVTQPGPTVTQPGPTVTQPGPTVTQPGP